MIISCCEYFTLNAVIYIYILPNENAYVVAPAFVRPITHVLPVYLFVLPFELPTNSLSFNMSQTTSTTEIFAAFQNYLTNDHDLREVQSPS